MADVTAGIGVVVTGGEQITALVRKVKSLEDAINRIQPVKVSVLSNVNRLGGAPTPRAALPTAAVVRSTQGSDRAMLELASAMREFTRTARKLGPGAPQGGRQRALPPGRSIPASQQVVDASAQGVPMGGPLSRSGAFRSNYGANGPAGGGGGRRGGGGGPGRPGWDWWEEASGPFFAGAPFQRAPAGAPRRRMGRGRGSAALTGGLQGLAFPLMFGQGMGAVAGGGLGGLAGGALLGPGGSFAGAGLGTAIGISFDAVSNRIKALSKDLDKPVAALEAIAAAGARVTDSDRAVVAYLDSIGRSGDAFDLARNKLDAAFGPGAFAGLRVLETSQKEFQNAIAGIAGTLGQQLLPTIIATTDYFTALAQAAEPLGGVLVKLADIFGYTTVFLGNNIKFIADLVGGKGFKQALKERGSAESFGSYKKRAEDKLDNARSGPAQGLALTPFEQIERVEKAFGEMTRKRDAAISMERESLAIARQREDLERSIAETQTKWARSLQEQELARKRSASDNLRQADQLNIERTNTRYQEQRQGLVSEDAQALSDGLAAYIQQRASGEADLRQKEREFQIATKELAIKQSQLEEDTAKEVFSITRQTQDYTKAVEDFKIKVADYQYQRALDAFKLSTAMGTEGGGTGGGGGASLQQLARGAGFTDAQAGVMSAIAMAESGGRPGAHNGKGLDDSYGLWQINMLGGMGPERRKQLGLSRNEDLFDPTTNARAAKAVFDQQGFGAWSVYKSGAYKQFLGRSNSTVGGGPASSGPTGWLDKEEFRKWLYSQGMGRTSGDFKNAGHRTPNHMLNAMDMGFTDSKYDSNYIQKTMDMEAKLRATGAFGDQLFGPLSDPKGHKNHLHIPTPDGRVPLNAALEALMRGTAGTMAGGVSPVGVEATPPVFQPPTGGIVAPNSAGFLAGSRANMQGEISDLEKALNITRQITNERDKAALMGVVSMFQNDRGTLAGLEDQLSITKEISAIDTTLPTLIQEQLASQIKYNTELDRAAEYRKETFAIVDEAVKAGDLSTEKAAKLNTKLTEGFRIRQDILAIEQQTADQVRLQEQMRADAGAANNILNFRKGYDAGYGSEAAVYSDAYTRRGPEAAVAEANAARVARLQQEASGDAETIAGALTGGIVQAIQSGNFEDAASTALASIGQRLIERAFRPLEEYLINLFTKLLAPSDSVVNSAASGLLGLGGGGGGGGLLGLVAGAFGGGGGVGAGIGGFGIDSILNSGIGAAFGGFLAEGGPAKANTPYIVGENGPELFVPGVSGSVVPNKAARAMSRYSPANSARSTAGADGGVGGDAAREGRSDGRASMPTIRLETTVINGVEYATVEQVRQASTQASIEGAKMGEQRTLRRMQYSAASRRRVGL